MPGSYTHITLIEELTSGNSLNNMKFSSQTEEALLDYSRFCAMGSISPDYPYLNLVGERDMATHWANSMHHKYGTLTKKNILHVGIDYLKNITGDEQLKCLSWFFGYASHVVADVTCHPVTNLLVGDYEADNEIEHRVSEMHQDVYIYHKKLNGKVGESEYIENVIGKCSNQNDKYKVDSHIEKMWRHLLKEAFPGVAKEFKIDIHGWHRAVQFFLEDIATELSILPSRHIRNFLTKEGVSYPRLDEIDKDKFINTLETPKGKMSFDQIFDHAKTKISVVWDLISKAVFENSTQYKDVLKIWNLDTGQEVNTPKVMWEGLV